VSVYSEAAGAAIVGRVLAGESVRRICAEAGQPHRTTVANWRRAHPDFDEALIAAHMAKRVSQRMRDRAVAAERAARPAPRRGGSASSYTPALGAAICARLENGESLTAIGRDPAMPCYGTMLKWVRRHPAFQEMYVEARDIQGDFLFDEARDVAKEATRETVPLARLQFDVIRWQSARLAPKKYLERLVAAEAAAARVAARDEAQGDALGDGGPVEVVFHAVHFEAGPDRRVLCAPPRNAREAQAWVESTGRPYESGVGPKGQIRPPMQTPEGWARADAHRRRVEAAWTRRR
jgi:transposase-like protein